MKYIKHTGEGQSLCSGCLVRGRQPINWDSMLTEVQYNSGTIIGVYCSDCLKQLKTQYQFSDDVKKVLI